MSAKPSALPDRRLQDWPLHLQALIADRLAVPFEWGARDCCLWAADVVQAVTGHDPAVDLRGAYTTKAEALAAIKRVKGLQQALAERLGPEFPPGLAQVGDVGLVLEGDMPAAVAYAGGAWMGQGPDGIVPVAEASVVKAWRCLRG